jgi:hypothetical protein
MNITWQFYMPAILLIAFSGFHWQAEPLESGSHRGAVLP